MDWIFNGLTIRLTFIFVIFVTPGFLAYKLSFYAIEKPFANLFFTFNAVINRQQPNHTRVEYMAC